MPRIKFKPFSLVAVAWLLQACANNFLDFPRMGVPEARCQAAGAEALLGQPVDMRIINEAIVSSGALRSRVIRPGSASGANESTDPLRINLEVDEGGRIRRLRCG